MYRRSAGACSRRAFLAGLGAGVVATLPGCGSGSSAARTPTSGPPVGTGPATPSPSPTTSTRPNESELPSAVPWTANPGEVNPAVKARATRLLQAAGTFAGNGSLAQRLSAAGFDPALAGGLDFLAPVGEAAVTNVVDAQYGGILADTASVLVPVQQ